ncbi:DUF4275 family protein [Clostridium sp.]|uniref:DUF4275 family protein n=1 Tax=Clostridium sp. TaxID=1506 RepID=UPI0032169711
METTLPDQCEDVFANHLSINEKRDIFMYNDDGFCGYLWHDLKRTKLEGDYGNCK